LVTPTTAVPPPTIEEAVRLRIELEMNRNSAPFNVYGLPTISIPCGFTRSGMPIGMQISGPRFGEAKVLSLAHAYEQATDWHTRRPHVVRRPLPALPAAKLDSWRIPERSAQT
jgi:aspartyl-tRNA(Asn)/glutamyl-tRNA(Gln) amidotransferase subunit A